MLPASQQTFILVDVNQIQQIFTSALSDCLAAQSTFQNENGENSADQLLTYQDTCDLLQVSRTGLYRWVRKGYINPCFLGGSSKPYFKRSEVMNALQAKAKPKLPL